MNTPTIREVLENLVTRIASNDLNSTDGQADLNAAYQILYDTDPERAIELEQTQHDLYLSERLHDNGQEKDIDE